MGAAWEKVDERFSIVAKVIIIIDAIIETDQITVFPVHSVRIDDSLTHDRIFILNRQYQLEHRILVLCISRHCICHQVKEKRKKDEAWNTCLYS